MKLLQTLRDQAHQLPLLIAPEGIEISPLPQALPIAETLLIAPEGIEMRKTLRDDLNKLYLLIAPEGIEIAMVLNHLPTTLDS